MQLSDSNFIPSSIDTSPDIVFKEPLHVFESVTLLVTHYNRSASLENLLSHFQSLHIAFGDIVVSDDGSRPEHLSRLLELQQLYAFRLIRAVKNAGLGNNINKGQDAVCTPYTLYVQEDFIPLPAFIDAFKNSLEFMQHDSRLDIVRYYAYFPSPVTRPYGKNFSEIVFNPWNLNHLKFYVYSDHPHLRRSSFFERFGRYPEGLIGDETEFTMCLQFLKRNGKAIIFDDISGLFDQVNTQAEPSTMGRVNWRASSNRIIRLGRAIYLKYRLLKNTIQLYRMK